MAWIGPVVGGLLGLFGQSQQNQANQQSSQQAQQAAAAQQQAAIQQAYALQQQSLGQALSRWQSYQQQNPNPINAMSILQAPNQGGTGMTFGGGTVGQPGTPGATQGAQLAATGASNPMSLMSLLQSLQAGQPSPTPNMPTGSAASPAPSLNQNQRILPPSPVRAPISGLNNTTTMSGVGSDLWNALYGTRQGNAGPMRL